jgi:hypothetical protein
MLRYICMGIEVQDWHAVHYTKFISATQNSTRQEFYDATKSDILDSIFSHASIGALIYFYKYYYKYSGTS